MPAHDAAAHDAAAHDAAEQDPAERDPGDARASAASATADENPDPDATARPEAFADVLAANLDYVERFRLGGLPARAGRGLAVLTCMDSRIEPLKMLGLVAGDAKILRNAGARVTDDVLRTLVLARYLLGVERVMVVAHTRCRMAGSSEEAVHAAVEAAGGPDTRSIPFLVASDQEAALRTDVQRARSWPYLGRTEVGGFLYDVDTGRLTQVC